MERVGACSRGWGVASSRGWGEKDMGRISSDMGWESVYSKDFCIRSSSIEKR